MAPRQPPQAVYTAIERLQRLSTLFQARRVALARAVGLTEQQWRVLEEISTEHFMPSLFARHQASSAAAVSKTLRQLLDKGLISVSVAPEDGRQRAYELTAAGRHTMGELRRLREEAISAIWSDLPTAELARFSQLSQRLIDRIEAYRPDLPLPDGAAKHAEQA